jgi:iron complex outermembrane receptor protein
MPTTPTSPWYVVGAGTQYHSRQDHLKIKLAYDFTASVRASYLFGLWRNRSDGDSHSYLRDAAGAPVESGPINIGGQNYAALTGADFALTRERLQHSMHGVSIKSHGGGEWDGEFAASVYDYGRDDKRQNSAANVLPGRALGRAGDDRRRQRHRLDDAGAERHLAAAGSRRSARRRLRRPARSLPTALSDVEHRRQLPERRSGNARRQRRGSHRAAERLCAGRLAARGALERRPRRPLRALARVRRPHRLLGDELAEPSVAQRELRLAEGGARVAMARRHGAQGVARPRRPHADGRRAVRRDVDRQLAVHQRPQPAARAVVDGGAERRARAAARQRPADAVRRGHPRLALLADDVRSGREPQHLPRPEHRPHRDDRRRGGAADERLARRRLDLAASVTYADSKIKENSGFVATPGDTIGKWQPNIPRWRATALASYRFDPHWSASVAARYSGRQYRTLNNSDVNGFTYQGVSKFATVDVRVLYRLDRQWSAAVGVDNLNDYHYWNFHPYPQRSYSAELRFDY